MSEVHLVQPLCSAQVKPAAHVLARAFRSDPAFVYVLPQAQRRESALAWLFERLVAATLEAGRAFTTASLSGVALWLGPGRHTLPTSTLLANGLALLPLTLGWRSFGRFLRLGRCTNQLHERTIRDPHLVLFALGVDPARQQQGIGRALLAPMLAEADANGLPCYLDTANAANLAYYAAHGFDFVSERTIAEALVLRAMVRMPRQGQA
ncbi:MAG: GNAT family N-acetyltransferase [candidate division KSB1 bacterium]|nr:GNAT family N-acetyltransferase [candidate division KSB1 bacterium]MDZ7392115.1 GNAT family N-acetyltransferase [candidate division KSB1 bacterium]